MDLPLLLALVAVVAAATAALIVAERKDPRAAIAFWANDILVARDRFARRTWLNRLYGLPLYYAAMVTFALTAGA